MGLRVLGKLKNVGIHIMDETLNNVFFLGGFHGAALNPNFLTNIWYSVDRNGWG